MATEYPTERELAAMTTELKSWSVERFTDRAGRQVLKFLPPEGDTINHPLEIRLAKSDH